MLHKKSILALALITAPLLAQATGSQGQLTFTWQATIPAKTIASTAWKFTDATGADYVPRPVVLQSIINNDNSLSLVTQTPASFEIRSTSNNNLNSVSAYLASVPAIAGLSKPLTVKNTLAAPDAGEVVMTLNGVVLKVGSSDTTSIKNSISNKAISMSLALYAKVAATDYTAGNSISFTTPIVFSVDVATSAS